MFGSKKEQWAKVNVETNNIDYYISNMGNIKTYNNKLEKWKKINGSYNKGYKKLVIRTSNKGQISFRVHIFIAKLWVSNPENGDIVVHINGNTKDNKVKNLKWMTFEEHGQHQVHKRVVNGEEAMRNRTVLTETQVALIKASINRGDNFERIAKRFKVSKRQIERIADGTHWHDIEAFEPKRKKRWFNS